jgi:hypothetical protein
MFGLLLLAGRMFVTAVMSSYLNTLWPRWLSTVSPHCSIMLWLIFSLPSPSYFPFCLTAAPTACVCVYCVQDTRFTHMSNYRLHQRSFCSNSQHFSQHTSCYEFCLNLLIFSYGKHCQSTSSTSGNSLNNQARTTGFTDDHVWDILHLAANTISNSRNAITFSPSW